MVVDRLFALKLISILGCVLIAGVFFAFSNFVMNALARLQPAQGITAMQSINITVINPLFMTAFLGTGMTCIFVVISSLLKWQKISITSYSLLGSSLYLIGTIGVTLAFNVPLNEALAKVDPHSVDGIKFWTTYLSNWTFWNHIRTVAAVAAAVSISLA
jgi:uncharacterized membrane protein